MTKLNEIQATAVVITIPVAAAATAATAMQCKRVPFNAKIVGAYFVPTAAMVGAASNNREIQVVNVGSTGSGASSAAILTYTGSVLATAYQAQAMTVSGTAAYVNVSEGDTIGALATVNGTGLPVSLGHVEVYLQAR